MGGTLGKIGQNFKIGLGKVEKAVAPAVGFIPGFGPIAAAALEANGNILDTSNGGINSWGDVGNVAKGSAMAALPSAAGPLLGKLGSTVSSIPGVQGIENAVGNIPGVSSIGDALKAAISGGSGGGGGVTGLLDFLGQHKDLLLGGAQALNAANLQQKAGNYANQAVQSATEPWNQRAPLRAQGVTAMLNASQYNPYSRAPGTPAPAQPKVTALPTTSWS